MIEAVATLRNNRAHGRGITTAEDVAAVERELLDLIPAVQTNAATVFGDADITLLRAVTDPNGDSMVIRLRGPHPDLRFVPEPADPDWDDDLAPTHVAAITPTGTLPIYPMFVPTDDGDSDPPPGLIDPAAMINGLIEGKRMIVLGVRSSVFVKGPQLVAAIARLRSKHADLRLERVNVKPWTIEAWARMHAQETLAELTGRKYFPSFYLERPGVDPALGRAEASPGRALLLLGEAGAGKSSLLARFVESRVGPADVPEPDAVTAATTRREPGDIVLWLSGRADYLDTDDRLTDDERLAEAVARKAGIAPRQFPSLADLGLHLTAWAGHDTKTDRLCWIVLDGLNEADRFLGLVRAIDRFLPALATAPQLRLVVAMRSGAFFALAERRTALATDTPRVFEHQDRLLAFPDANQMERSWLDVRPFHDGAEAERAYRLRQQALAEGVTDRAWSELATSLRAILRNPLYLHLFHKTWRGRVAPRALDGEEELLDAYLDEIAGLGDRPADGASSWLERLGDMMLAKRAALLTVDDAQAWCEEWLRRNHFEALAFATTLDPVEQFVAASILLRPAESGQDSERRRIGNTFTQQKLAERVLLKALDRRLANGKLPDRETFACWLREAAEPSPYLELVGALTGWVARLVRAGQSDVLAALFDVLSDPVGIPLLARVLRASIEAVPDGAVGVLQDLATTAATKPNGRANFLVRGWPAAERISLSAPTRGVVRIYRAFSIYAEALAASDPDSAEAQRDLSVSYNKLGDLALRLGDGAAARDWLEKARQVSEALAASDPDSAVAQRDLSISYDRLGDLALRLGDGAAARDWFEKARQVSEALAASDPDSAEAQRDLSISYDRLGDLALRLGDGAAARDWFEKARQVSEALAASDPDSAEAQRDLSISYDRLGDLALRLGDGAAARDWFEKARQVSEALAASDPDSAEAQRDLSISYDRLGDLALRLGDGAAARDWFEKARQVREALAASDPDSAEAQRDLAVCYARLGICSREAGDKTAARALFARGLAICDALLRRDSNDDQTLQAAEGLRQLAAELDEGDQQP